MAIARIPLPEQSTVDFETKCDEWLQRAAQQRALAKEMIKQMHEMRDHAAEMRKPPNPTTFSWRLVSE
jgi:hypothetical protein